MAQLKRLLRYAGAFRRQFLMAALLAIGLAVLGPLRPYLVELTVDRYIFENNFKGLVIISLISLGVLLVESAARFHFI